MPDCWTVQRLGQDQLPISELSTSLTGPAACHARPWGAAAEPVAHPCPAWESAPSFCGGPWFPAHLSGTAQCPTRTVQCYLWMQGLSLTRGTSTGILRAPASSNKRRTSGALAAAIVERKLSAQEVGAQLAHVAGVSARDVVLVHLHGMQAKPHPNLGVNPTKLGPAYN